MTDYYDASGRPVPNRRRPTLTDYQQLEQAYRKLQAEREELVQAYRKLQNDRDEAIQRLRRREEAIQEQTEQIAHLQRDLAKANQSLRDLQREVERLGAENAKPAQTQPAAEPAPSAAPAEEDNWQERYLRLQAEMDNYRKRLEQRSSREHTESRHQILRDMLPVADHLEMALQHSAENATEDGEIRLQNLRRNLEATLQAFLDTLKRYGVQRIYPLGEVFDPNLHEAMGRVPNADLPEDHVAHVVQAGYLDEEKLIRPARVLLGTFQQAEQA